MEIRRYKIGVAGKQNRILTAYLKAPLPRRKDGKLDFKAIKKRVQLQTDVDLSKSYVKSALFDTKKSTLNLTEENLNPTSIAPNLPPIELEDNFDYENYCLSNLDKKQD